MIRYIQVRKYGVLHTLSGLRPEFSALRPLLPLHPSPNPLNPLNPPPPPPAWPFPSLPHTPPPSKFRKFPSRLIPASPVLPHRACRPVRPPASIFSTGSEPTNSPFSHFLIFSISPPSQSPSAFILTSLSPSPNSIHPVSRQLSTPSPPPSPRCWK